MKNYIYITLLFLLGGLFQSCQDKELDYYQAKDTSSITAQPESGFINFSKLETENISIDIAKDDGEDFNSVDISASYGSSGSLQKLGSINGTSGNYSIELNELTSTLGVNNDDIEIGDNIVFYFDILQNDGSVIRDRNTVVLPFSCPSDLAGTYSSKTSASSTDGCCADFPLTEFESEVTLTQASDGKYQISDFSAGAYFEFYDVYGIGSPNDSPGKIQDVCGNLSFFETTEPFGTEVTGTGTFDESTGIIMYDWINGYGDKGTVVLTPK